jgi:hypothetical protein
VLNVLEIAKKVVLIAEHVVLMAKAFSVEQL